MGRGEVNNLKFRPYTGNRDGPATGKREGMNEFIRQILFWCPMLWDNGSWGIRDQRSHPGVLSVHATGRADDAAYSHYRIWKNLILRRLDETNRHRVTRKFINKLTTNANVFEIELILDYFPKPYGAGWRCDRQSWTRYTQKTVSGAPGGMWYHIEITPAMADNPEAVRAAFLKVFGPRPA